MSQELSNAFRNPSPRPGVEDAGPVQEITTGDARCPALHPPTNYSGERSREAFFGWSGQLGAGGSISGTRTPPPHLADMDMSSIFAFDDDVPAYVKVYIGILFVAILVGMVQSLLRGELFDFRGQVQFYMSYHLNPVNILIHVPFVPTLLYTGLGLASSSGPLFDGAPAHLDLAALLAAVYAGYYLLMGSKASLLVGITSSLFVAALYATVQSVYLSNATYMGIHVVSWIFQFYGHAVHEKRKPALLTNLSQSLIMAPLFVYLEILFFFGWNKELHTKLRDGAVALKRKTGGCDDDSKANASAGAMGSDRQKAGGAYKRKKSKKASRKADD